MSDFVKVEPFFHEGTSTWSYAVFSEKTKACVIIDPVIDFDPSSGRVSYDFSDKIVKFVIDNSLCVHWVLETHIHADHLSGLSHIKGILGCKTGIGAGVKKVLKLWYAIFEDETFGLDGAQFDKLFEDNDTIIEEDLMIHVLSTPGHTPCDVTYVIGSNMFVGDVIFLPDVGTGRCDFLGGSAEKAYASIHRILAFPDEFIIHVGHDYPPSGRGADFEATVKEQKTYNVNVVCCKDAQSYVNLRKKRETLLPLPRLFMPAVQFNMKAGSFFKDSNGIKYIKIPINRL